MPTALIVKTPIWAASGKRRLFSQASGRRGELASCPNVFFSGMVGREIQTNFNPAVLDTLKLQTCLVIAFLEFLAQKNCSFSLSYPG